jgi:hypothetical protein
VEAAVLEGITLHALHVIPLISIIVMMNPAVLELEGIGAGVGVIVTHALYVIHHNLGIVILNLPVVGLGGIGVQQIMEVHTVVRSLVQHIHVVKLSLGIAVLKQNV